MRFVPGGSSWLDSEMESITLNHPMFVEVYVGQAKICHLLGLGLIETDLRGSMVVRSPRRHPVTTGTLDIIHQHSRSREEVCQPNLHSGVVGQEVASASSPV